MTALLAASQGSSPLRSARTVGLALWVVGVALAVVAAEWADETQALRSQKAALSDQVASEALRQTRQSQAKLLNTQRTGFLDDPEQMARLREQTQASNSEARNYVALIALTRKACEAGGLRDCQATRSAASTTASIATGTRADLAVQVPLTEYSIKVIGSIDQSSFMALFEELDRSGRLYRLQRANISGRRVELDLVFWLDDKAALVSGEPGPAAKRKP